MCCGASANGKKLWVGTVSMDMGIGASVYGWGDTALDPNIYAFSFFRDSVVLGDLVGQIA